MFISMGRKALLMVALALVLVACKSTEERAEDRYQSGLSLLEAGDVDRALVEFRNVFDMVGTHKEARRTYAETMLGLGRLAEAYSQYLRLVEQYPDDLDGRLQLATMAFNSRSWDEFDRHGSVVIDLAPDTDEGRAISLSLAYRKAVTEQDEPATQALTDQAVALAQDLPNNDMVRRVLIDGYSRSGQYAKALVEIDKALAEFPDRRNLYDQRLAILTQLGDTESLEIQLKEMVDLFPEDQTLKSTLLRFYMSRGEPDKAEQFLRDIADPADEDPTEYLSLVQFLSQVRGVDAAREELQRGIEVSPKPLVLKALMAGFDYTSGDPQKAISALEALVAEAAPAEGEEAQPNEELQGVKVALARMQVGTGNEVAARRLVEEVLAENPLQVEALKMQATWLIAADQADQAVATLRTALDSNPEDAQAMTLMSRAYSRAGSHDLARDFLALAVDASGNAPEESIRYARRLMAEERYLPAEDILIPALRLTPGHEGLLTNLGQLYVAMEDTPRARQVISTLRKLNSESAEAAANNLEATLVNREDGVAAAVAFLEGLASGNDAKMSAKMSVLRARVLSGELDSALRFAEDMIQEEPENPQLRYALAATKGATGDLEGAQEIYRELVTEDGKRGRIWMELSQVTRVLEGLEGAEAIVDEGLAANPDDATLMWAKASYMEYNGDIEGAIGIYEALYERQSNSLVIANNLASLLASYRDDAESLERAFNVARRLRGTEVPALMDTYGWIVFRRGDAVEAVSYLEGAVAGLPSNPLVHYHLASAYDQLERASEALEMYQRAADLAGPGDTRRQIEEARAKIVELQQAAIQNTEAPSPVEN